LVKLLLLLSASLSLHSALAVPLSSVLEKNYHAVAVSDNKVNLFNSNTVLNDFAYKQFTHSKLQTSLLSLLQQTNDDTLIIHVFLCEINKLDINLMQIEAQTQVRQLYQAQLSIHTHILGAQNTLYSQKNSYQAKLQLQQTS